MATSPEEQERAAELERQEQTAADAREVTRKQVAEAKAAAEIASRRQALADAAESARKRRNG